MSGRRKEIDRREFEKLCALQCTEAEICRWFQCSPATLLSWCKRTYGMTFEQVARKYGAGGKISLRRIQFQLAEKNATMAIFLGKVLLGQREDAVAQDDNSVQKANEQAFAIADLINRPLPERTLADVDNSQGGDEQ